MVRKVIAAQALLKASGTVTGKLLRWLAESGHIDEGAADDASARAREAARDLPIADRLRTLLHDVTDHAPAMDPDEVARKASDLARPGWSAFVTAAKIGATWHLLEVGVVYP